MPARERVTSGLRTQPRHCLADAGFSKVTVSLLSAKEALICCCYLEFLGRPSDSGSNGVRAGPPRSSTQAPGGATVFENRNPHPPGSCACESILFEAWLAVELI